LECVDRARYRPEPERIAACGELNGRSRQLDCINGD
jgi:hypothetical protein